MTVSITDDFDLAKIAESGQCFRWSRMGEDCYRILHGDRCLYIEKTGEGTYRLDCGEREYETVWKPYLDLGENYAQIRGCIDPRRDPFLYRAAEHEAGIRILRQDPWETLVSFLISQNRNIPAIKRSIEALAQAAGEGKTDGRGQVYYTFPTPEAVAAMSETDLKACKLGYRWKYVRAAALDILAGKLSLKELAGWEGHEAIQRLTELYGVGVKVASCVALYGLHHTDAFPIDIWVKRVLENEYPQGYPYESYRPYNGLCQQYLFAYYRNRQR